MSSSHEPLILALETATRAGSICLARGPHILGAISGDEAASHSIDLLDNIERLLRDGNNTRLSDIAVFAVANGPGSFTGLRIGLATVKSFAACTGAKCAGISTLAAIALTAGPFNCPVVALLPAGRGEVFVQMFSMKENLLQPIDEPVHITPEALLNRYREFDRLVWTGEGARLQIDNLRAATTSRAIHFAIADASDHNHEPEGWLVAHGSSQLANAVAALAFRQHQSGGLVGPDELRASYVRPSDAEINQRWEPEKSQPLAAT